jgi:hypothetical protein
MRRKSVLPIQVSFSPNSDEQNIRMGRERVTVFSSWKKVELRIAIAVIATK